MNGPHIGSLSRGVSVQMALKAPVLKANKSCVLVNKSFIFLELVPGGKVKVAWHNRGGRRPEVLVVVVWQGLAQWRTH